MYDQKIIVWLAIVFFCFLFACQRKYSTQSEGEATADGIRYPISIPFEEGVGKVRDVPLSQIARQVRYIHLETTSQSLLKRVSSVLFEPSGNQFYISDLRGVYMFSGEGRFIGRLGRNGQGPGEYSYIRSLVTDKEKEHIYVLSNGKLISYLTDGTWKNDWKAPDMMQFILLNDTTIVYFVYNSGYQKHSLLLTNLKGDSIGSFPQYERAAVKKDGVQRMFMGANDRFLFSYAGEICFKDYYSDSLFVVKSDSLQVRYVFQMGSYGLPPESRFENIKGDINQYNTTVASYLRPTVLETKEYIFLPTGHWMAKDEVENRLLIYDKRSCDCYEVQGGKIKDDLCGGSSLYPFTTLDDSTLLGVCDASIILENAAKDPGLLERMGLRGLTEDDNPVLMLVTLK